MDVHATKGHTILQIVGFKCVDVLIKSTQKHHHVWKRIHNVTGWIQVCNMWSNVSFDCIDEGSVVVSGWSIKAGPFELTIRSNVVVVHKGNQSIIVNLCPSPRQVVILRFDGASQTNPVTNLCSSPRQAKGLHFNAKLPDESFVRLDGERRE